MAGFFDDMGEFFTGDKGAEAQRAGQSLADQTATEQAQQAAQQQELANGATAQAAGFDQGARDSMGANAADYMAKANAAAMPQAAQEANVASVQSARNALMAARSAGMNRGASAVQAGQQATNGYTQNLNNNLQQGRGQYQAATQQFANRGDNLAQRGQTYQNAGQAARQFGYQAKQAGVKAAQDSAAQSAQAGGAALSGALGIGGKALGLPGFAKGTDSAPGGPVVVGEDGPEVAVIPKGSKIIPSHKVDPALLAKLRGPATFDDLLARVGCSAKGGR